MASPDHQVGAHFEALDEGVLMAPSKSIGYFFAISSGPEVRCLARDTTLHNDGSLTALLAANRGWISRLVGP